MSVSNETAERPYRCQPEPGSCQGHMLVVETAEGAVEGPALWQAFDDQRTGIQEVIRCSSQQSARTDGASTIAMYFCVALVAVAVLQLRMGECISR